MKIEVIEPERFNFRMRITCETNQEVYLIGKIAEQSKLKSIPMDAYDGPVDGAIAPHRVGEFEVLNAIKPFDR